MTEWDPDLDDYHVPPSDGVLQPLPAIAEEPGAEAQEREAKRQRVLEGAGETANYVQEGVLRIYRGDLEKLHCRESPGELPQARALLHGGRHHPR